jgi:hypothetical protein
LWGSEALEENSYGVINLTARMTCYVVMTGIERLLFLLYNSIVSLAYKLFLCDQSIPNPDKFSRTLEEVASILSAASGRTNRAHE